MMWWMIVDRNTIVFVVVVDDASGDALVASKNGMVVVVSNYNTGPMVHTLVVDVVLIRYAVTMILSLVDVMLTVVVVVGIDDTDDVEEDDLVVSVGTLSWCNFQSSQSS